MLNVETEEFNPPYTGMVCNGCGSSASWQQEKPIEIDGYFYCDQECSHTSDDFPCKKCGWTVKPWYLRCEACGDSKPYREPPETIWYCLLCNSESTNQADVETCCSPEEDEWVIIDEALADLEDEKRYQQQETP